MHQFLANGSLRKKERLVIYILLSHIRFNIERPPSLLQTTVYAIEVEALDAISGGEGIPAATVGVDGPSSVTVRAVAGITSASDLTVGGG